MHKIKIFESKLLSIGVKMQILKVQGLKKKQRVPKNKFT